MKIFRCVFLRINKFYQISQMQATPLNCISMKNQECKTKPQVINVNSNNPTFHPFSIKTSKCSGNCNTIHNPYAKICAPDVML